MKQYDKLGTRSEPARLMFIKYMIDTNKHQGLYNLIAILGNKFYCLNDLEEKKDTLAPVLIKLQNSLETSYQWVISIVYRLD